MNRAMDFIIAFVLGVMFAFLLLYAIAEPLQAPAKRAIRIEV